MNEAYSTQPTSPNVGTFWGVSQYTGIDMQYLRSNANNAVGRSPNEDRPEVARGHAWAFHSGIRRDHSDSRSNHWEQETRVPSNNHYTMRHKPPHGIESKTGIFSNAVGTSALDASFGNRDQGVDEQLGPGFCYSRISANCDGNNERNEEKRITGMMVPQSTEDVVLVCFLSSWQKRLSRQPSGEATNGRISNPSRIAVNKQKMLHEQHSTNSKNILDTFADGEPSIFKTGLNCIKVLLRYGHHYLSSMHFVATPRLPDAPCSGFLEMCSRVSGVYGLEAISFGQEASISPKRAQQAENSTRACTCLLCAKSTVEHSSTGTRNDKPAYKISHVLNIIYAALNPKKLWDGQELWLFFMKELSDIVSSVHTLYDVLKFLLVENSDMEHLLCISDGKKTQNMTFLGSPELDIWGRLAVRNWLCYLREKFVTNNFFGVAELFSSVRELKDTILYRIWCCDGISGQNGEETKVPLEDLYNNTRDLFIVSRSVTEQNPLQPIRGMLRQPDELEAPGCWLQMEKSVISSLLDSIGCHGNFCDEKILAQRFSKELRCLLRRFPYKRIERLLWFIFKYYGMMNRKFLLESDRVKQDTIDKSTIEYEKFAMPLFTPPTLHRLLIVNQLDNLIYGAALNTAFEEEKDANVSQSYVKSLPARRNDRSIQESQLFMVQSISIDLFVIYLEIGLLQEAETQAWLGYQFAGSYNAEALYAFNLYRIQLSAGHILKAFHQLMIALHRAELSKNTHIVNCENTLFLLGRACFEVARMLTSYPNLIYNLTIDPVSLEHTLRNFQEDRNQFGGTRAPTMGGNAANVNENLFSSPYAAFNSELLGREGSTYSREQKKKISSNTTEGVSHPPSVCGYIANNCSPYYIVAKIGDKYRDSYNKNARRYLPSNPQKTSSPKVDTSFPLKDLLPLASMVAAYFCNVAYEYGEEINSKSAQAADIDNSMKSSYLQSLAAQLKGKALLALAYLDVEKTYGECLDRSIPSLLQDLLENYLDYLDKPDTSCFWGLMIKYAASQMEASGSLHIDVLRTVITQIPQFEKHVKFWMFQTCLTINNRTLPDDLASLLESSKCSVNRSALCSNECWKERQRLKTNTNLETQHAGMAWDAQKKELSLSLAAAASSSAKEFLAELLFDQNGNARRPTPDAIAQQLLRDSQHMSSLPKTCVRSGDACRQLFRVIDLRMEARMSRHNHPDIGVRDLILHCIELAKRLRNPHLHLLALFRLCLFESRIKNLSAVFNFISKLWQLIESIDAGPSLTAEAHFLHGKALVALISRDLLRKEGNSRVASQMEVRNTRDVTRTGPNPTMCSDPPLFRRNLFKIGGSHDTPFFSGATIRCDSANLKYKVSSNVATPRRDPKANQQGYDLRKQGIYNSCEDSLATPASALRLKKKARVRSEVQDNPFKGNQDPNDSSLSDDCLPCEFHQEILAAAKKHIQVALFLWEKFNPAIGVPNGIQQHHRLREALYIAYALRNINTRDKNRSSAYSCTLYPSEADYWNEGAFESCENSREKLLDASRPRIGNPMRRDSHIVLNLAAENTNSLFFELRKKSLFDNDRYCSSASAPSSWMIENLMGRMEKKNH